MPKITKDDFEYFKKECLKWIDKLGLHDWEWYFYYKKLDGNISETSYDYSARRVQISLHKELDLNGNVRNELRITAFHEVFELLVGYFQSKAWDRIDKHYLECERHGIVHRVWNILKGKSNG